MSSEIASVGKHSLIFMIGMTISKLTSFLMLPIYTRFLTPTDYGVLELLQMTIDVVGMIGGMTIASAVFRFHADCETENEQHQVLSTAFLGILGLAVVTGCLGIFASPWLKALILPDTGRVLYFQLFFAIYILQAIETVPLLYLRALNRSGSVVMINVIKLVAMLGLNVYFVVHLRMAVMGVLLGNLIASAAMSLGLAAYLFSRVGAGFSLERFRELARYGYPLAAVSLANFFMVFSDRYFLNHYATTADVGIYSLAYKFAFLLTAVAFTPFMMAWGPQRFVIAKQPNAGEVFRRVFLYLNLALGFMALCIVLFAGDVLRVMSDPTFHPAAQFVPVLLAAQVVHHWTAYNNLGLKIRKTTGVFAWASLVGVGIVLLFNFLLIPRYGIAGAAWATLISYVFRFLMINGLAQRRFPIDYGWATIARLYALFGLAYAARRLIGPLEVVPSVGVGLVIAVAIMFGIYRGVLTAGEREALRGLALRPLSIMPRA